MLTFHNICSNINICLKQLFEKSNQMEGRNNVKKDCKKSIMDACMHLMEKKDFNSVTVREIAEEANVNVAAINYYFGDKTKLFHELMELYWDSMMQIYLEILQEETLNEEKVCSFGERILRYELKSTGILRSEQVMYQQYGIDNKTRERIQKQFMAINRIILWKHPTVVKEMIYPKSLALISALTCPGFWSDLTDEYVQDAEAFIKLYVKDIITSI